MKALKKTEGKLLYTRGVGGVFEVKGRKGKGEREKLELKSYVVAKCL